MALQRWLVPSNVHDDAERYRRELIPASCDLILASPEYKTWESTLSSNLLRIVAYPGAGKTFFASAVVQRLKSANLDVAYFFCRNGIQDRDATINVLRTLLSQTIRLQPSAYRVLAPLYHESGRTSADSVSDMLQCYRSLLNSRSQMLYLVIDGIDELTDKSVLFDVVKSLINESKCAIKVLMTGRDEVGISKAFHGYPMLRISPDMTEKPIEVYVARQIAACDNLSASWLGEKVLNKVLDKAEGLWLFAKLMTDAVIELPSVAAIERQLNHLPSDLSEMYFQILERHADALKPWQFQWAEQLFLWVDTEDYFWLDTEELVGLSKIDGHMVRVIFQAAGNGEPPLNPLNIAKTLGGPMIRIKIKDFADVGIIEYIHLSARDYILSTSDAKSHVTLPRLLRLRRLRQLFRGATALWFFESSQEALDLLRWFQSDPKNADDNWWDSPYPFVVYGLWNSFHVPALPDVMDYDEYCMAEQICNRLTNFLTSDNCMVWVEASTIINYSGCWMQLRGNCQKVLESIRKAPRSKYEFFQRYSQARWTFFRHYEHVLATTGPRHDDVEWVHLDYPVEQLYSPYLSNTAFQPPVHERITVNGKRWGDYFYPLHEREYASPCQSDLFFNE